jgi:membrane-bound lytic murein transglycosylase F
MLQLLSSALITGTPLCLGRDASKRAARHRGGDMRAEGFATVPVPSLVLIVMLALLPLTACQESRGTLDQIKESGELRVITRNNANTYYIYRGQPMGFEYELAKAFSDALGVELSIKTTDWLDMFEALNKGKGDMVASGVTITAKRDDRVDFSQGYMEVQQQVVVNRDNRQIRELEDLANATVHVREGTTYQQRLQELNADKNMGIDIVLHQDEPTEELIRKVARDTIDITIADSNIALLNRRYYPEVRVAFPIQEPQQLGWAVQESSDELLERINEFLAEAKASGLYGDIYERYYGNVHIFDYVDLRKFHQRLQTRLPKFKDMIQTQADKYGFDWKLIAAVIYQESHLNPQARSFTGVKGLMQVTLTTAREMGISNRLDPKQSVAAGVGYLHKIYQRWEEISGFDRMLFSLASYNIGYGHVRDAQKLAEKRDLDPTEWSSLEKTLPLLRIKKYYKDTTFGYARGTEPVRYVNRILTYYDILRKKDV